MPRAKRHLSVHGLDIAVEYERGDARNGHKFLYPYGYIKGIKGADKEHLDVYLGPDVDNPKAYVIRQMKKDDWKSYDEDKVMLGWPSKAKAVRAYVLQYRDRRFFGGVKEVDLSKEKLAYSEGPDSTFTHDRGLYYVDKALEQVDSAKVAEGDTPRGDQTHWPEYFDVFGRKPEAT